MPQRRTASIVDHCGELEDPRIDRQKQPQLLDVIVLALCAVLCGAEDWVASETWGKAKEAWVRQFLALPNGIPSPDTFGRVFALLSPARFQECFVGGRQAVAEVVAGQVVAIDGKTVRRSYERRSATAAMHLGRAWATQKRLVLGQLKTAEKSNESTAIPELRKVLDVQGGSVTIEARGGQKARARQIVEQEADDVLALKQNHGTVYEAGEQRFQAALHTPGEEVTLQAYEPEEQQQGRVEIRRHWTREAPADLVQQDAWVQLRCLGVVESARPLNGQVSLEQRYYLASLDPAVKQFARAVRAPWGMENCVHWVLEIAFREDESRVRVGHAPEHLAVLRHMALNLLRQEPTAKVGIRTKRLKAGWEEAYLATLVFGHTF